jgi:hypothetical protein
MSASAAEREEERRDSDLEHSPRRNIADRLEGEVAGIHTSSSAPAWSNPVGPLKG